MFHGSNKVRVVPDIVRIHHLAVSSRVLYHGSQKETVDRHSPRRAEQLNAASPSLEGRIPRLAH